MLGVLPGRTPVPVPQPQGCRGAGKGPSHSRHVPIRAWAHRGQGEMEIRGPGMFQGQNHKCGRWEEHSPSKRVL